VSLLLLVRRVIMHIMLQLCDFHCSVDRTTVCMIMTMNSSLLGPYIINNVGKRQKTRNTLDCHHALTVPVLDVAEVSSEIALRCDDGGADWAVCGPCMPSSAGILRACVKNSFASLSAMFSM